MKGKWQHWLPVIFVLMAALSRWPGLLPPNFSVFYALMFCAGVFFPRTTKWWLPMGALLLTDVALNVYYLLALGVNGFSALQVTNWVVFAGLILFGSRFNPRASFAWLLAGGITGAILFYLVTNTLAWWLNPFHAPEYTKNLAGWIIALTKGTTGYPTTLQFFLNTLYSGGLFTGLFVGAVKLTAAAESPREKEAGAPADDPEDEPVPDEAG